MSSRSNRPAAPFTAVQKRSFKRACRRAILNGSSHYHGSCMRVEDFPPALVQKLQAESPLTRCPRTHSTAAPRKGRLTCLHWNPGGLAQSTLAEIRLWLQRHPVDIVVLTETRWSFSSTWTDKAWMYVHSASDDYKSGGILIMISRRLACPEQLGHQAIVDGRLVHVRVHFDSQALDILAIYQYVDNRTMISAQKREQARLREILQLHGLTAINTWGASGRLVFRRLKHGTAYANKLSKPFMRIIRPGIPAADIKYFNVHSRKLSARGPDGTIADQYMAHSLTVAFVKQMWQGPSRLPTYHAAPPGIPFELEELVEAVAKDFLCQLDWTQLQDLLHLIHSMQAHTPEVPISPCPDDPIRVQVPPMLSPEPTDVRLTPMSARDTVHRHFQVTTQPFWPELERCLHHDDWPGLCQLSVGLEHLVHHCAICGTWCNRFQELHSHYRLYHDEQLKGGVVKGAQLTHVMQLVSPCALCNKQYSRVHSCPVTLQIGILRLQMQEPDIRAQQELTCEICVQQFDDQGQLYQHMARDHNQTLSDWVPSRDSVQGSDQCRHCSMQFDSRSGLRRHITEGRCEAFDPLASHNPTDNTAKWSAWLHQGDFSPTGLSAHQRLQLTTTCQFCEAKYMRTGDVVAHLLQSHGPLWNASQPMLRYLLQVVMASRGCICNPQAHEVGLAHICTPLRQVAMMMANSDVQLLVPTQFHVDTLAPLLAPLRDEALTQRMIASLVARNFAQLWTDTAVVHALKSRCMACGGHYQPAELLRHLLTVHPQTCAWATQIAFQLHDLLSQLQLPYCCSQFMDALMDPNDQALMDGLAALGPLLLGSRKHHEGSVEEQHPERHKAKAKEEQDHDGLNKEAITTLLRLMGQLLLNHERSIQLNQRQDCFVLFCQNRPEGIVPHLTMLASKWREEWPQQKDNLRWPNLRTYLMKGVITELLRRVQQLAATKPGDQLWDVAVSKGTIHPDGSWGYQKWSQETKQLIKASRSPVAMARVIRGLQILEGRLQSNAHVVRFQSLKNTQSSQEAIPWILQISHREAEAWELLVELCHNTVWSQDIPESLDAASRQSLRDRALNLAMANPGNDCYANSAFVSLIWATLSRSAFVFQDWGARSAILQQTLELADGTLFSLENASWFQHLLEGWNEDGEQADSAEFAHMLSSWTAMPAISNCWERRVQTEQGLVLHDAGDKFMPLTLQFDPQLVDHHEIQLSTLLRTWHTELGMLAGLTDPEDLLLLHVDRMIHAPDGTVVKCQAALRFGWEVQIPVLGPHACTWMPYTVIACIAHLGGAHNGHYQALLRTYPEVSDLASPSMWMLCDDGHSPQRILNVPEIFAQGITCLWLCQTSKADFHRLAPGRDTAGIDDTDLLALLATQPDPEP
ncbi:unnamed protein product [Cladocopium goreaui]|uniref:LINE-1 reverse transcriptase-like n=1 Tax=Cladocopium goreaui TaxID=2562237 RepID=A0A9P1DIW4_9DINO|nr:unnamed protein product [Cladocopium goreaui]